MEYHKIETLYERADNFKLKEPLVLKNPVYGILKSWVFTEKVDGTNIRVYWEHALQAVKFCGRTNNAQLPADLFLNLTKLFPVDKFLEHFPDTDVLLYGEGFGAGIQKVGKEYRADKSFILFDVMIGPWWLSMDNVLDVGQKLGIDVVPVVGEMSLEEATEMVRNGFKSLLPGATCESEGLIGKPVEALFDKKGSRLIIKLKTKDFG